MERCPSPSELPPGWIQCISRHPTSLGCVYFKNKRTDEQRWNQPHWRRGTSSPPRRKSPTPPLLRVSTTSVTKSNEKMIDEDETHFTSGKRRSLTPTHDDSNNNRIDDSKRRRYDTPISNSKYSHNSKMDNSRTITHSKNPNSRTEVLHRSMEQVVADGLERTLKVALVLVGTSLEVSIVYGMSEVVGDDWTDIVKLKPPWNYDNCLCIIKHHWATVFSEILPRQALEHVDTLLRGHQKLVHKKVDSVVTMAVLKTAELLLSDWHNPKIPADVVLARKESHKRISILKNAFVDCKSIYTP